MRLWYDRPSTVSEAGGLESWNRALPIGNGRLGAMVYGDWPDERLQVNEQSIWAGPPLPGNRKGAGEAVRRARELLFAGNVAEAERVVREKVLHPHTGPRSYQPFGDITLHALDASPGFRAEQYERELCLDTAIASVSYVQDGVRYRREAFSSAVDQVLVIRLEAEGEGKLHTRVDLSREADASASVKGTNRIVLAGQASHEGAHPGVKFAGVLHVGVEGGSVAPEEGGIAVRGADAVTLLLAVRTDYRFSDPFRPLEGDLAAQCEADLEQALRKTYEQLKQDHIAEYGSMFRRVELRLVSGTEEAARQLQDSRPTDQRLEAVRRGEEDAGLIPLLFQFGRYLLISSSRPGCMPANLQGIWNPHMKAPWDSDYHININLQMNYWPSQVGNLAECHLPYFDLVEGLVPAGRETAREVYGCRGFVAHYTTDAWLFTAPLGGIVYGMWPMGAGWCVRDFMEYYRFTGDREFLRSRAFPILKEAAAFYLDWLVEHPETGQLVSGPSVSPENSYVTPDGGTASLCMAPAMDQQIIWDVFTNVLEAAEELGERDEFSARVEEVRSRLALPGIGRDGRLMEWCEELVEAEPGHRHISHLYGLHPGAQYTYASAPDMMEAARRSLEYRLGHGGGHTGWSRAWIVNFWSRLKDAEQARRNLELLLAQSILPNLFDNHPPFQIDGNFGATAGIAEMLLQSHAGKLELLPALPKAWSEGEVKGLRARGGFEVDIQWRHGKLLRCTVTSSNGRRCAVDYAGSSIVFGTCAGASYVIELSDAEQPALTVRQL
ncbi:glycoside hydrolase family 95 protein [Paenibacillus thermotolerans]|uniref:glycoside hydrolase family 95 protein n=1 Tax=Paenibacillus thermotolerans TaxID=3027807 RepID=UPI0023674DFA|nr:MULTISPECIES: glycoside hydrolase family 95 protein [unclassified Paenibacillus]